MTGVGHFCLLTWADLTVHGRGSYASKDVSRDIQAQMRAKARWLAHIAEDKTKWYPRISDLVGENIYRTLLS